MKTAVLYVAALVLVAAKTTQQSPMTTTSGAFLDTLTESQRTQVILPIDSDERKNWHYVPKNRKGISWGEMTEKQRSAAHDLLKTALSEDGYKKIETIRSLEAVLRELENGNLNRDQSRYWFVFFGTPNDNTPWVWRYEGHHLSMTFTINKGKIVSSTPQFLGSNPGEVKSGPKKGTRVLADEQDLGFQFVQSLNQNQIDKAMLSKTAPDDILTSASRKAVLDDQRGLSYREMTKEQQKALLNLLEVHARVQSKTEQKRRFNSLRSEGHENLVFAWLGSIERKGKHYYRILGKGFLVEYDNTQDDGNHIHTVWRDFEGDFGEDALAKHYHAAH